MTNAVLERRGARICLLTTVGFEDVPYIQRRNRRYAFDLHWQKPKPLVRRRHCIGVAERIDAVGGIVEALTDDECVRVVAAVRRLVDEDAVEAVAVCLLFSYVNDAHERLLADCLAAELPDLPVSLSSSVSPIWREYERVSTVLADAYVKPIASQYLQSLSRRLETRFGRFPIVVLKSNGGAGSPESVAGAPALAVISGLAGGVVGGGYFSDIVGEPACITFDMGGTSTDVGLLRDGQVGQLTDYEIEWGLPLVTPAVDVRVIGAGGGSIAHVDPGGLLRVGPESAGAVPGPACYGRGGREPTVTDANLVLGRLNPDYFLGGELTLDRAAAEDALRGLADPTGQDLPALAAAIIGIANENMANAIRLVTIERGIDPREYTLLAFGGAGPLHACEVADAVGIRRIVVPPHPGLCSALGAAIASPRIDRVWSVGLRSPEVDQAGLRKQFEGVVEELRDRLVTDGLRGEPLVALSIACRYYLQNYEHEIPLPELNPGFLDRVCTAFHALHREVYGYAFDDEPVEVVNCKVTVSERGGAGGGHRLASEVLERAGITGPATGPLVIEEPDSTVYVADGWSVRLGPAGCLVLDRA
jgi:N-methylhydantoinase A